jgi:N-methylhydantoinase A
MSAFGEPILQLTAEEASSVADMVAHLEVDAVAVVFLHSFSNPTHELRMAEAVRKVCPNAFVCSSHEILAEILEYERTSTTVLNAMVGPVLQSYLSRASQGLVSGGYRGDLLISSSAGGMMTAEMACSLPAKTMLSGPAAGVIAAQKVAVQAGFPNAISFEMGGTSLDVGIVERGNVRRRSEWNVAFGTPVRLPVVDVASIGAGGGTIAWIDMGGALRCGPMSAGADPGPAAYGRGGTRPTLTDAQLVLGRLDPARFLGGEMLLRTELAEEAIRKHVGEPLGVSDVSVAAAGILKVAEHSMVEALRLATVNRGRDPREFVLVGSGGAGPLFAASVAALGNIPTVIVPAWPGLMSALGLLMMEMRHEKSRSLLTTIDRLSANQLADSLRQLCSEVTRDLVHEGFAPDEVSLTFEADLRYFGTSHVMTIPLEDPAISRTELAKAFVEQHQREYGYTVPEEVASVEVATVRVFAVVSTWRYEVPADERWAAQSPSGVGGREVYFEESGFTETVVYDREKLVPGMSFKGPAIVEQDDSTSVVPPGTSVTVDRYLNLVLGVGL